jgi:hypothetical protein
VSNRNFAASPKEDARSLGLALYRRELSRKREALSPANIAPFLQIEETDGSVVDRDAPGGSAFVESCAVHAR